MARYYDNNDFNATRPPPPRYIPDRGRYADRYDYDDGFRAYSPTPPCKDPVTRTRTAGNKTRVHIMSARDAHGVSEERPVRIIRNTGIRHHHRSRSRSRSPPRRRSRYSDSRSGSEVALNPDTPSARRAGREREQVLRERTVREEESRRKAREGSQESHHEEEPDGGSESEDAWARDDSSVIDFDLSSIPAFADNSFAQAHSSDLLDDAATPLRPPRASEDQTITELHLQSTRWLGDPFDDSTIGAEFTTLPTLPNLGRQSPAVKWFHLERALMSFDEFIAVSQKACQLSESDLRHVVGMLRKVQQDHEKQRQHGREMEPICVADVDYRDEKRTPSKKTASVCFLSIPFFTLQLLAKGTLKPLSSGSPNHAPQPLVQSQTRMVSERRELSQAITSRTSAPKGHCLHVSSVWCLLVNNDTILTCSQLPMKDLHNGFSTVLQSHLKDEKGAVEIGIGSLRKWHIPSKHVQTWPSMAALFGDNLTRLSGHDPWAKLMSGETPVNRNNWSTVLDTSRELSIDGTIRIFEARLAPRLLEARTLLRSATGFPGKVRSQLEGDEDVTRMEPKSRDPLASSSLRLFSRASAESDKTLIELADALNDILTVSGASQAKRAYSQCPVATYEEVISLLFAAGGIKAGRQAKRGRSVGRYKEEIAIMALYMFVFFWPKNFDHIMTRKYLGALKKLLDGEHFYGQGNADPKRDAEMAQAFHEELLEELFGLAGDLSNTFEGQEPQLRALPSSFHKAWLYLLNALVLAAGSNMKDADYWRWRLPIDRLNSASRELREGERLLTLKLRRVEIDNFEACPTFDIVALVLDRLCRDIMHGNPDVAQTYGEYCSQLDAKIIDDPLTRSHQEKLRSVNQETEAIMSTLTLQLDVLNVYGRAIEAQDSGFNLPDLPAIQDSRLDLVIRKTKATLGSRIDQFKALQGRMNDLGDWHLGQIDTNKDRQESAIMVFTIVTIIFLPLSFVSGVLGMNTADVRDMSLNQWVYWASALPLTIVVVGVSLWWAEALDDFKIWAARTAAGRPQKQGFVQEEPVDARRYPIARASARPLLEKAGGYGPPPRRTTYPRKTYHSYPGDHYV